MESTNLTAAEVAAYHHDGQLIPENYRMPPALLTAMQRSVAGVLEHNPDQRPENLMNVHLEQGPEGVKGDPAILEYARHPSFLDMSAKFDQYRVAGFEYIVSQQKPEKISILKNIDYETVSSIGDFHVIKLL